MFQDVCNKITVFKTGLITFILLCGWFRKGLVQLVMCSDFLAALESISSGQSKVDKSLVLKIYASLFML